ARLGEQSYAYRIVFELPERFRELRVQQERLVVDGEVVDTPRIDFLRVHIDALEKAMALGADVRGYYPWSFIDLLSWLNGYKKQYGFVYVDHKQNLMRKRKKSFFWYKDVIASRGENR
ncbi:MAG: glycoside hydrolase family 1 protein, partial [Gammaproteobacteria bacterium]|nr:glycoside hydrolase family 1 protein [Gammaproteobacteria bacterium]